MKKILPIITAVGCLLSAINAVAQNWAVVGNRGFSVEAATWTKIAIDTGGTPYVAYIDGAYAGNVTVMKYIGSGWVNVGSPGFSGSPYGAYFPALHINTEGTPFVGFHDYSDIYEGCGTVMTYSGSHWDTLGGTNVSSLQPTAYNCMAIDPAGTVYMAFTNDSFPPYTIGACVVKYSGGSWESLGTRTGFTPSSGNNPIIIFDSTGTPFVSYVDGSVHGKLSVMKYTGGSWVNVGSPGITDGAVNEDQYQFTIDRTGALYLVYPDSAYGYRASVMKYNGSTWSQLGSPGFSAGEAAWSSIAIDTGGTPYVAYCDGGSFYACTVMKFNGISWVNVGSPGFTSFAANYSNITFDKNGIPYLVYQDDSTFYGGVTVMKYVITPSLITGEISVCVGDTIMLGDSVSGGSWSSNNPASATVNPTSGIVTGIAAGTSTISYTLSGISATLNVAVYALPELFTVGGSGTFGGPTIVSLSSSELDVSYQLYNDGVLSGSPIVGTGHAFTFPADISGTYYVVATNLTTGCTDTMTDSAIIIINTTGIPNVTKAPISISPNPTSDEITIQADATLFNTFTITNTLGIVVMQGSISNYVTLLNLKDLPAGVYFVTLTNLTPILSKGEGAMRVVHQVVKM